jgi:hypothetical protein
MALSLGWLIRDRRAVLPLVLFACCAVPERAAAGCGDYLTVLTPAMPADHPLPCRGSNCSAAPDRPLPSAPAIGFGADVKESARPSDLPSGERPAVDTRPPDLLSSTPVARPTAIFHPPRVG